MLPSVQLVTMAKLVYLVSPSWDKSMNLIRMFVCFIYVLIVGVFFFDGVFSLSV